MRNSYLFRSNYLSTRLIDRLSRDWSIRRPYFCDWRTQHWRTQHNSEHVARALSEILFSEGQLYQRISLFTS